MNAALRSLFCPSNSDGRMTTLLCLTTGHLSFQCQQGGHPLKLAVYRWFLVI